jgi:hypothetical protein
VEEAHSSGEAARHPSATAALRQTHGNAPHEVVTMPALRAKRPCGQGQCPALVSGDQRYCEKHLPKAKQKEYEAKRNDEFWMMYQTPMWRKFRAWFLRLNPQCQRIVDGKRCEQIADTVHHRISPRKRPDLFRDADNVKAVCREHHPPTEGDAGTEVWADSETLYGLEMRKS